MCVRVCRYTCACHHCERRQLGQQCQGKTTLSSSHVTYRTLLTRSVGEARTPPFSILPPPHRTKTRSQIQIQARTSRTLQSFSQSKKTNSQIQERTSCCVPPRRARSNPTPTVNKTDGKITNSSTHQPLCPSKTCAHASSSKSQIRHVKSSEAVAAMVPSKLMATSKIVPSPPPTCTRMRVCVHQFKPECVCVCVCLHVCVSVWGKI